MLSAAEAAEIWGIDSSAIRKAIIDGRLIEGQDCRKFGKQWVITVDAMARVFKGHTCAPTDYGQWHRYLAHLNKERSLS